jgi:alanyl-tRNA synthetase
MAVMTSTEIRASFLAYFERNGHRIVPSSPLVPGDDPTLLFTNAGMNQFKDVFLGRDKRSYTRATTAQKCMRVSGKHNDLDNVGPSLRHHTFFEMLGNFSFGDYFKADAIAFAWELLTGVWRMAPERLIVSVFKGEHGIPRDEEAYLLWRRFVPADRILELGTDDNFWQMGDTGPCGRCSEIYYVHGSGSNPEIEIWNNVFMEFERSADGTLTPLPAPSIDTGMGLERIAAVLQHKASNYDTDLFVPLLTQIEALAGRHVYAGSMSPHDISMRVVADHIRAMTCLIADGVMPSNEWRGYVLRKIMRRAMRHGRHLGMTEPFLHQMVAVLDREMGDAYPELRANRATIERTILAEERRFDAVLTEGLPRLEAEIARALDTPARVLPGEAAFRLYDTFGLPYDFIEDTAATQTVTVDRAGYERAMEGQRGKARAKSAFTSKAGDIAWVTVGDEGKLEQTPDTFEGYTTTRVQGAQIVAAFDETGRQAQMLHEGSMGYLSLTKTPFYLEAGGQVSDSGRIDAPAGAASVDGLVHVPRWPRLHQVRVTAGRLSEGDLVTAEVDGEARHATRRNHTATHLLHEALRRVLGAHVKQAGSLVAPARLRFDFAHFQPVTQPELDRVELIVNEQIWRNTPVQTELRSTQDAIAAGAVALFGEKYGEQVRVVSVPGFSLELCGGTHVGATGDIGFFAIASEGGVAAGVRRIEAVTGAGSVRWVQAQRAAVASILGALRVPGDQAVDAIERLQSDAKRLARELTQARILAVVGSGGATAGGGGITTNGTIETHEVCGVKVVTRGVADLDKEALRGLADSLRTKIKSGVVVLASTHDGKVQVVVAVTPDLTSRVKAGQVVKEIAPIVGGGGGGRPDFAEAGGRQPEKIAEMLAASDGVIARLLGAA